LGGLLQGLEDDCCAGGGDGRDSAEAVAEDAAKGLGVGDAQLDEVAVFARDLVDLLDFGDPGKLATYGERADFLGGPDEDEGEQAEGDGGGVEAGFVAADDATGFEFAYALVDGGGGHANLAGDLGVGHTGVLANNRQDLAVNVVNHGGILLDLTIIL